MNLLADKADDKLRKLDGVIEAAEESRLRLVQQQDEDGLQDFEFDLSVPGAVGQEEYGGRVTVPAAVQKYQTMTAAERARAREEEIGRLMERAFGYRDPYDSANLGKFVEGLTGASVVGGGFNERARAKRERIVRERSRGKAEREVGRGGNVLAREVSRERFVEGRLGVGEGEDETVFVKSFYNKAREWDLEERRGGRKRGRRGGRGGSKAGEGGERRSLERWLFSRREEEEDEGEAFLVRKMPSR